MSKTIGLISAPVIDSPLLGGIGSDAIADAEGSLFAEPALKFVSSDRMVSKSSFARVTIDPPADKSEEVDGKKVSELMAKLGKVGDGAVTFDIYQIIALLTQVMNELKKAAKEIRVQESLAVQKSILSQAGAMEKAAKMGLVTSAVISGVQVGAFVGGVGMMLSSSSLGNTASSDNGVNAANKNLKAATEAQIVEGGNVKAASAPEVDPVSLNDVNNAQQNYSAKLETVKAKHIAGTKVSDAEAAELKEAENSYVTKYKSYVDQQVDAKKGNPQELETFKNDEIKARMNELQTAQARAAGDSRNVIAAQRMANANMLIMMANTLGNLGMQIGFSIKEMTSADAKRIEASTERARESLEEIKELVGSHQKVIDGVLALLGSVVKVEDDTHREIMA